MVNGNAEWNSLQDEVVLANERTVRCGENGRSVPHRQWRIIKMPTRRGGARERERENATKLNRMRIKRLNDTFVSLSHFLSLSLGFQFFDSANPQTSLRIINAFASIMLSRIIAWECTIFAFKQSICRIEIIYNAFWSLHSVFFFVLWNRKGNFVRVSEMSSVCWCGLLRPAENVDAIAASVGDVLSGTSRFVC